MLHADVVVLLLWAQTAGNIDQQQRPPSAAATWRSAANVSSVMVSADVGN